MVARCLSLLAIALVRDTVDETDVEYRLGNERLVGRDTFS